MLRYRGPIVGQLKRFDSLIEKGGMRDVGCGMCDV